MAPSPPRPARPKTYFVVGLFATALAFPFYWMFLTALKTTHDLYDPANVPVVFNEPPTFEHIRRLLSDTPYVHWLGNTMVVGVLTVALTLAFSVPGAYALARGRGRAVRAVSSAMFLTYLVPSTVLFLPLSRVVSEVGLHDSLWSLVLVYPSFTVPGSTWLLAGFFKTVPAELEDAALVDGCSRWRAWWSVVLPVSTPGIVAVAIFSFTLATNEFTYAVTFITSAAQKTVSAGLPTYLIRGDILAWGPLMAGVLLPSVVIGLLYTVLVVRLMSWWSVEGR
jgi:multiple sugar transport system permease protein